MEIVYSDMYVQPITYCTMLLIFYILTYDHSFKHYWTYNVIVKYPIPFSDLVLYPEDGLNFEIC
jgi:hypothetical protein